MYIPKHVGAIGDTDEEYDQRERHSSMHTPPLHRSHAHTRYHFPNTFAGTTS